MRRGATRDDAEDLVSAGFANLLSLKVEQIQEIDNLRAYLHAVTRNLHLRLVQEAGREAPAPDEHPDPATPERGFERLEEQESRTLVVRSFKRLSEKQQRILWLSIIEERSTREIGELLGVSVSNVTTQTHRARAALREAYVAEFIALSPPACGTSPDRLARIVSGTATRRQAHQFAAHLRSCTSCAKTINDANREATWLPPVAPLVALGGVAGGMLSTANAPAARTRTRNPRTLFGVASIVAGGLFLLWWMTDAAVRPNVAASPGVQVIASSDEAPAQGGSALLSAEPSRITLQMPPAGGTEAWRAQLVSNSTEPRQLLAAVSLIEETHETEPAHLSFSFDRQTRGTAVRAARPIPLGGSQETSWVYLGSLEPGEKFMAGGNLLRSELDTDQTASALADVVFVLVDRVPQGTRVGGVLREGEIPEQVLADTGSPPGPLRASVALTAIGGAIGGAILGVNLFVRVRRQVPEADAH